MLAGKGFPGRHAFLALVAGLFAGCGGGGGGSITVSTSLIAVSGTPGDTPVPLRTFTLNISGASGDLYLDVENSENGIDQLQADDGTAVVTFSLFYRDPGSLLNGTYADDIVIRVCKDAGCSKQLAGSPLTVRSSYVVSGEGQSAMQVTAQNLQIRTNTARSVATEPRLDYSFQRPANTPLHINMDHTTSGIESGVSQAGVNEGSYSFRMKAGQSLAPATYTDTITLRGCYHPSCVRQVPGSPFVFQVTYGVEPRSDVVAAQVPLISKVALTHDVVDAEYSRSRDRLIMVGRAPVNALYVHDPATGQELTQALGAAPTSVAVSADGQRAAVGHDGSISIVDLGTAGAVGAPMPQVISVPMNVFDLVMENAGFVHATGIAGGPDGLRSIFIAGPTQQQTMAGWLDSVVHLRLHPAGNRLYTPDGTQLGLTGPPIVDIARWNLAGGTPAWALNRTIHRTLEEQPRMPCDELWFNESGTRLFESCGHVFALSADVAADLSPAGTLALSWAMANFKIAWLDHSAARGELALIEYDSTGCPQPNPNVACNLHLRLHDAATLATRAIYNIPVPAPAPGNSALQQRARFVFYSADGSRLLMLSRLVDGGFNDAGVHYLSAVQLN